MDIYQAREFYAKFFQHFKCEGVTVFKDSSELWRNFPNYNNFALKDLNEGDKVRAFVARVSGSQGSWMRKTNKYHGYVLVDCIVSVSNDGQRHLVVTMMDQNHYWCAIDREKESQKCHTGDVYIVGVV